jgi:hypothetical protein
MKLLYAQTYITDLARLLRVGRIALLSVLTLFSASRRSITVNMTFKNIFTVLCGLVALSAAAPLSESQLAQQELGVFWQAEVQSYVNSIPAETVDELTRAVESTSAQACEDVYLIFARGTFEPAVTANLGMMVGGPLTSALKLALGAKFEAIGVDYNNNVQGYLSGVRIQVSRSDGGCS